METEVRTQVTSLDLNACFASFPRLETERLVLRALGEQDLEDIFAYASDPEVARFVVWPRHQTLDDTRAFLKEANRYFDARERLTFGIQLKSTGQVIGGCGFHDVSAKDRRLEIGYVMNRAHWGHGYMTEAVWELLRFVFDVVRAHRVEAVCDLDNVRSYRVMERLGMTYEGTFRDYTMRNGAFVSLRCYSLLEPEYRESLMSREAAPARTTAK